MRKLDAGAQCSFCGAPQGPDRRLIAGSQAGKERVYICSECVHLSMRTIEGDAGPTQSDRPRRAHLNDVHNFDDLDPAVLLEGLRRRAEGVRMADEKLREAVLALRRKSVTWMRIGEALGISRQSAWERFSDEE